MSNPDWRNNFNKRGRGRGRGRGYAPGTTTASTQNPVLARRQLETIASVSRSSGLEKDGDTLKDFKVQEDYRRFIQDKLNEVLTRHPWKQEETTSDKNSRISAQENVMILFRKLREGISSSNRRDHFALEVYETSLYLSAIFDLPRQTASLIPHLIPDLYLSTPPTHPNRLITSLISLVHHLISSYPSQGTFDQHLFSIPSSFLRNHHPLQYKWIVSLSKSLRIRNYVQLDLLSRQFASYELFGDKDVSALKLAALSISQESSVVLAQKALLRLLERLREKSRETSWDVIRAAYREFSCQTTVQESDTRLWLARSLCLNSVISQGLDTKVEDWLEQHISLGHTRRKEGSGDRWIVCKAR